jgi:tetratricopeptide (TPR) repeat protein
VSSADGDLEDEGGETGNDSDGEAIGEEEEDDGDYEDADEEEEEKEEDAEREEEDVIFIENLRVLASGIVGGKVNSELKLVKMADARLVEGLKKGGVTACEGKRARLAGWGSRAVLGMDVVQLGVMAAERNRVDEARFHFKAGLQSERGRASGALWHAWAQMEQREGNLDEARRLFRLGLEASPRNRFLWLAWGALEAEQARSSLNFHSLNNLHSFPYRLLTPYSCSGPCAWQAGTLGAL